ncbi:MAG: PilZ domain-containing protein [Pyrinomonadaceae bacterium]
MGVPETNLPDHDRRRFPRYYVRSRMTLAIEDESLRESIGLGEPGDISLGGVRVRNLPACRNVTVGTRLGLLLMDRDDALTLHGEVVHHGTLDTFGVEFRELTPSEQRSVLGIIGRLH